MSCANDGTIRIWSISGSCDRVLHGVILKLIVFIYACLFIILLCIYSSYVVRVYLLFY